MDNSNVGRKLQNYWKLASVCNQPEDKINFFDLYLDALLVTPDSKDEFIHVRNCFQKERGIDFAEYQRDHGDYPNEFKIIAFDYCILNGKAYSHVKAVYGLFK